MADLSLIEKRKLERALGMGSGYVLNFSNKTFKEFFRGAVRIEIFDAKYDYESGSKANRMRKFWEVEGNNLVGRVLDVLFKEWDEFKHDEAPDFPSQGCLEIAERLMSSPSVPALDAITPNLDDKTFEALAKESRDAIENNQPEVGLDRLHTFATKYFRVLCEDKGLEVTRDMPLHSLVGSYIRILKSQGIIESQMTERILKSSISVMDAFNEVRNNQSLAHDNIMLNHEESLLIYSHVASSLKFVQNLERNSQEPKVNGDDWGDDIPF